MRIVAVICARDEEAHIAHTLESFVSQSIEVLVIDNDSTDRTRQMAETFLGRGLVGTVRLPWSGRFSLSDQLRAKQRSIAALEADWVIHADADEWMQAPKRFRDLRDGIEAADRAGYNCINFDEFVFAPVGEENFEGTPYRDLMKRYYFFEPRPKRLVRAWRKDSGFDNFQAGGHELRGNSLRLFPEHFILRHYIVLSRQHAARKYLRRRFAEEDLARGWHANRIALPANKLTIGDTRFVKRLTEPTSRDFDRSEPVQTHFWQW